MDDLRWPTRTVGRRSVLAAGLAAMGAAVVGCQAAPTAPAAQVVPGFAERMADLERRFVGRIGVAALDTGTGLGVGHRADERFLLCSTVKVAIVAAVLQRAAAEPGLLGRRVRWTRADVLEYAPVTTDAVDNGLTVSELCAAALVVSDNTAANLMMTQAGGPDGVTAFLRTAGDITSRSDRTEPTLNDVDVDGDRDTTTPTAYLGSLQAIALGPVLPVALRDQLVARMVANTTGDRQIRAGTPAGWRVADKTGSGSSGESNDVGIVWPPGRPPILLTVYTAPTDPDNDTGRETIAAATREVLTALTGP